MLKLKENNLVTSGKLLQFGSNNSAKFVNEEWQVKKHGKVMKKAKLDTTQSNQIRTNQIVYRMKNKSRLKIN